MRALLSVVSLGVFLWAFPAPAAELSSATSECLDCHRVATPGIVDDWEASRHARTAPGEAQKKSDLERKVSTAEIPENLAAVTVGCAECHTLNSGKHRDTFNHNEQEVHVVVSPEDCATCHFIEKIQYQANLMSQAFGNLNDNPVYRDLVDTVNGIQEYHPKQRTTMRAKPSGKTEAESCFYCHGTRVAVKGTKTRETDLGDMEFPVLEGWPNQGVGRINPDGTKGSCASCHPRHQFSIEVARKPDTCAECHKGPDVPAYPVYKVSKHGNIYSSLEKEWDFTSVPWILGKDFTAPTCAACHASLVVSWDGEIIAERSHAMNDRLPWRIFGLVYAHPHPESPDTTVIKNQAGLPLPTELTGEPAAGYVISKEEQEKRWSIMRKVCLACHDSSWVDNQYARLEHTIGTTNQMTLTATQVLLDAWRLGAAKGLDQGDSIFNEAIEKMWVEQWLFFANSTRFATAMAGADYGVFANGRWQMSKNIQQMLDWIDFRLPCPHERKNSEAGSPE